MSKVCPADKLPSKRLSTVCSCCNLLRPGTQLGCAVYLYRWGEMKGSRVSRKDRRKQQIGEKRGTERRKLTLHKGWQSLGADRGTGMLLVVIYVGEVPFHYCKRHFRRLQPGHGRRRASAGGSPGTWTPTPLARRQHSGCGRTMIMLGLASANERQHK